MKLSSDPTKVKGDFFRIPHNAFHMEFDPFQLFCSLFHTVNLPQEAGLSRDFLRFIQNKLRGKQWPRYRSELKMRRKRNRTGRF